MGNPGSTDQSDKDESTTHRATLLHHTGYKAAMIDHIGVSVSDLEKSIEFYKKALAPLGYELLMNFPGFASGFGVKPKPDFWIGKGEVKQNVHVAFRAAGRAEVRAFYEAAMAAGATDNGPPGPRPHYHEHYYGGFVKDPDGHNIEAVCHEPFLG
jgi:catechol 2,3-dioxygenase-like lactoylglutathione lyase family enzyme